MKEGDWLMDEWVANLLDWVQIIIIILWWWDRKNIVVWTKRDSILNENKKCSLNIWMHEKDQHDVFGILIIIFIFICNYRIRSAKYHTKAALKMGLLKIHSRTSCNHKLLPNFKINNNASKAFHNKILAQL